MTNASASVDMVRDSDSIQFPGTVESGKEIQEKFQSVRTTNDRMSDEEIEEDIMDISLSDDEAELSLHSPKAAYQVQSTSGFVDDDETYEPPSERSITQYQELGTNARLLNEDLEPMKADLPAEIQDQRSADRNSEPIEKPTSGVLSPGAGINLAIDEQSRRSLPHSPSQSNASDPDEYEPPEPAPLGEEVPRPTCTSSVDSEKSFSPPDGENNDFVARRLSDSIPAIHKEVSVDAMMTEAGSH